MPVTETEAASGAAQPAEGVFTNPISNLVVFDAWHRQAVSRLGHGDFG